jgi:hypothetical protein
VLIENEKGVSV